MTPAMKVSFDNLNSPFIASFIVGLRTKSNFTGMIHKSRPIFSTQFHPEAKGGPLDSSYLFDIYIDSVIKYKNNQAIFHPMRDSRPSPLLVDLLPKERVGVSPTNGMSNAGSGASAGAGAATATA